MTDTSAVVWGITGMVVVVGLIILDIHIALSLALVGFVGIVLVTGHLSAGLSMVKTVPYAIGSMSSLGVLPLFILMGYLTMHSGISQAALEASQAFVGRLPGGLSLSVTWACVGFGAISGSSIAATSVFTKLALPQMQKAGYDTRFALGSISTAAVIAMLIPPSILMVVYSMLAEESLAKLLIGGITPGLLLAGTLTVGTIVMVLFKPQLAPRVSMNSTWRDKMAAMPPLWPIITLIVIILGGIYSGVFSPNEAAAIGTVAAFGFAIGRKGLTWTSLSNSLLDTLRITASVIFILIGANMFTRFMAVSGIVRIAADSIVAMHLSPVIFIIAVTLLYLVLGCFIDQTSAMALTLPILMPIVRVLNIDPIYFGVMVVTNMSMAQITPPFGLVAFATKAAAGPEVSLDDVFRGIMPFLVPAMVCLGLVVAFPVISVFLPNAMIGK